MSDYPRDQQDANELHQRHQVRDETPTRERVEAYKAAWTEQCAILRQDLFRLCDSYLVLLDRVERLERENAALKKTG